MSDMHRREFIKRTSVAGLGVLATSPGVASFIPGKARSPNETVRVAIIGVNGRGGVHAKNFALLPNSEVAYVCDVDANVIKKGVDMTKGQAREVRTVSDFRRVLDDKSVDAVSMATPDHWHAPMTLLALQAGKHVFLEKPSGHNPREDELLMEAARKHTQLHVQLGTQRRSAPHFFEAIQLIKDGAIGKPYLARCWYANTRASIGRGKPAPVPAGLDYELWQGPAPHTPYRDNVIHYNWHWFTRWGTGEICNNGTHEIDVARWLLGVDYPTSVSSAGGRFHFDDDWEFTDTQDTTFTFDDKKVIAWHGQSCNGQPLFGRGRGTLILGSGGSLLIDQDGYIQADLKGKPVKDAAKVAVDTTTKRETDALNRISDDPLTELHMRNFLDAIRTGAKLNAPIEDGAKTGLLCHLGTIAQQTGRKLRIDPKNGHILGDADAAKLWSRSYEPGWVPAVAS
ncbi:MAG TPA: Gfo/Idh/MocA family oxidoreductase [Gemmatimonadaceae bacterium]|nr:Gfo/Idh/MocA family oxidoreductase [Gemmatimonadaceae bacterium]